MLKKISNDLWTEINIYQRIKSGMTHHSLSCITATVDTACSKNLLGLKYALYLDKNFEIKKHTHKMHTHTQTQTRVNTIYHTVKYLLWRSLYMRTNKWNIYIRACIRTYMRNCQLVIDVAFTIKLIWKRWCMTHQVT